MKVFRYFWDEKDLNDYEKESKRLSYKNLFYDDENLLLCNNITDADPYLWDNLENGDYYDDENDYYIDIYQYYLIDYSTAERLKEFTDEIIFYSDLLDLYVLGVSHFGTSWAYILTDIKLKKDDENGCWIAYIDDESGADDE